MRNEHEVEANAHHLLLSSNPSNSTLNVYYLLIIIRDTTLSCNRVPMRITTVLNTLFSWQFMLAISLRCGWTNFSLK